MVENHGSTPAKPRESENQDACHARHAQRRRLGDTTGRLVIINNRDGAADDPTT